MTLDIEVAIYRNLSVEEVTGGRMALNIEMSSYKRLSGGGICNYRMVLNNYGYGHIQET